MTRELEKIPASLLVHFRQHTTYPYRSLVKKIEMVWHLSTLHTLFNNSGPFTLMKLALLSLATAFASNVFPHPGGPHSNTPHAALIPTFLNISGLLIGCTIAMCSSSLIPWSAPTSDQDTSGTVANPSRFEEGWTCDNACIKSSAIIKRGESWISVREEGCALRKYAIEPGSTGKENVLDIDAFVGWETGRFGADVEITVEGNGSEGSITIVTSGSCEGTAAWCCCDVSFSSAPSEITCVPSESCLKIRLTAMIPAAPVSAAKSAPT